jgi:hypothetical protein
MIRKTQKMKFDKVILTVFLSLFCLGQAKAQESATAETQSSHSLYDGAKALQFRIADNFVLNNFQGAALSGKKHISNNSAIRLGFDIFFDISTLDDDRRVFYNDTTITTSDAEGNTERLVLELQYIRYVSTDKKIKFYWGTGPSFRFSNEIVETDYYDSYNDISRKLKDEDNSWGAGASGVLGAEWFVASYISFHSEYVMTLLYEWRKVREDDAFLEDYSHVTTKSSGLQLYASNVRFGLSLYF